MLCWSLQAAGQEQLRSRTWQRGAVTLNEEFDDEVAEEKHSGREARRYRNRLHQHRVNRFTSRKSLEIDWKDESKIFTLSGSTRVPFPHHCRCSEVCEPTIDEIIHATSTLLNEQETKNLLIKLRREFTVAWRQRCIPTGHTLSQWAFEQVLGMVAARYLSSLRLSDPIYI